MKLIDSHAHLIKKMYGDDFSDICKAVNDQSIEIINIGIDIPTSKEIIELAKAHKNFYAVVGIHPVDTQEYKIEDMSELEELVAKNRDLINGIGESGIDLKHKVDLEHQKSFFQAHIELARKFNLPLVIHCREAFEEILPFVRDNQDIKFLMHSWTGEEDMTKKFLELKNVWFGFNGIVTFNSAKEIAKSLKLINIEKMLIETDCPFLSPVPLRGKKNNPTHLIHILNFLAKYLNMNNEDLANILYQNTKGFFKL